MTYSERLDALRQRVAAARTAVQDTGRESREHLKQRDWPLEQSAKGTLAPLALHRRRVSSGAVRGFRAG